MHKTMQRRNDEPLRRYEWRGAGIRMSNPAKSKRAHPWHASYGVLALLTSLLILNGCDNQGPAEQASDQIEQRMKGQPLYDDATSRPMPPEAGAPATGEAPEQPDEKIEPLGEDPQKP